MSFKCSKTRSPAPGWTIEITVQGANKEDAERIMKWAMGNALLKAEELLPSPEKKSKRPCGCNGG